MKKLLYILILVPLFGSGQDKLVNLLDYSKSDSIHVYPSAYSNLEAFENIGTPFKFYGEVISRGLLERYHVLKTHSTKSKFYALELVQFSDNISGLIVGIMEPELTDSKIAIWLIDTRNDSISDMFNLAYYKSIPATMEETMNGWIYDCDQDGDLDIAIMIDLVDYELPNEFSDNISGVEGYAYYIEKDSLSYDYLSKENYYSFLVKR